MKISLSELLKRKAEPLVSANGVLLMLFVVTFGIFFIGMPRYMDDLWYSTHLRPWIEGTPGADLWQEIKNTWYEHYLSDNARLCNLLCVPFMALPKWVGSGIATLLWGVALVWALRLIGIGTRQSPMVPVALTLWAFCLPWYDGMGIENFQFNYIYSTAMALGILLLALRPSALPSWAMFIAGALAGAWHEGFTIPLIAALIATVWGWRSLRTRNNVWLIAGLCIGLLWLVCCPGVWERFADVRHNKPFTLSRLMNMAFYHPAYLLSVVLLVIALFRHKVREALVTPLGVMLMVIMAVSFGINIATTPTPRTGWWGEFCAIMFSLYMLRILLPSFASGYTCLRWIIVTPMVLVTFSHQVIVDYYSLRIRHSFTTAVEKHLHTGNNVVFTEIIDEHHSPLICMYAPDFTTMIAPVALYFINGYYHPDNNGYIIMVPHELRRVTATSGTPVPSDSLNMRCLKDGRLFMPVAQDHFGEFLATVDFGYTVKHNVRMIYYPFVSEADGRRYAFVYPWRRVVEMRIGHIRSVTPTTPL